MKVLELFSGTGSVSKVCETLGYEVISIDISNKYFQPTFLISIFDFDYKQYPVNYFDIIWASPPCATFSQIQNCWIGRGKTLQSIQDDINKIGLPLLRKAEEIIDYLKPTLWVIENPQTGKMKNYLNRNYYDVDYCMYCDWGYQKRTRIWTNKENFENKLCNKKCVNIDINTNKHRIAISHTRTSLSDRYRIPPQLVKDLFFGL